MDINIQDKHYNKYLKYKLKYLELKQQSGGMVYTPSYCEKGFLSLFSPRYKMCNIYYYNNTNTGDVEQYLKNNLINEYKEDLKKKKKPFNDTSLNTINTFLQSKFDKTLEIYNKPDGHFKTRTEKATNQNLIDPIKKEVLAKIDEELGNTAFKDDLKEILSTYFTSAFNLAANIRSVEHLAQRHN
jgi:hypothetical protein